MIDENLQVKTMNADTTQKRLLDKIASTLPDNISLALELADLLDISSDSAYRRIRGETELSIKETHILCEHFQISFDEFVHVNENLVTFSYEEYEQTLESFEKYFAGLREDLMKIRKSDLANKHITYLGDNLPILHYFNSPNLSPFKLFYWTNIIMPNRREKFHAEFVNPPLFEIGQQIYADYMNVPSTEVWTDSTILGVIEQILFYWNTGMFESKSDAIIICNELRSLINLIERQTERGKKFMEVDGQLVEGAEYNFYYSEIEFENTCIHVELGEYQMVYLGHLSHRYIKTTDKRYAKSIRAWYQNILNRSNLLSKASETVRYRFFSRCYDKIENAVKQIELTK